MVLLMAAAGLLGCASATVKTDRDPRVDLRSYETFRIVTRGADEPVLDRIRYETKRELEGKGLRAVADDPELLVYVNGTVGPGGRVDFAPFYYEPGWSPAVYTYRPEVEAVLLIEMVQADGERLVWRGVAQGFTEEEAPVDRRIKRIQQVVAKMLRSFPSR
jgi:hypothetical protein